MCKNDIGYICDMKEKVTAGGSIDASEALRLSGMPLDELCKAANDIRKTVCGDTFDLCSIINGKSGRCTEDCKFCAQSGCYDTDIETYPLISRDEIIKNAEYNRDKGVLRYSIVTSGRNLSDSEVECICDTVKDIKGIEICLSSGMLKADQFEKLKEAGVKRFHCNLEAGKTFFPHICTTHSFDDKIEVIKTAKRSGLEVCSGGIMGLGESMKDRIDMAISIRDLGVKSVPVNMLNPIPGTPLAQNHVLKTDDMRRIVAVYRFILPDAFIRLAGGRGLLKDKGRSCFMSGSNAAITGDMLTTSGISIETDMKMLAELGYKVTLK